MHCTLSTTTYTVMCVLSKMIQTRAHAHVQAGAQTPESASHIQFEIAFCEGKRMGAGESLLEQVVLH